jgi:hypothetical protein
MSRSRGVGAMVPRPALALLAVLPLLALAAPSGALGAMVAYTGVGEVENDFPLGVPTTVRPCPRLPAAVGIQHLTDIDPPHTSAWLVFVMGGIYQHPEAGNDPDHPLLPPPVCSMEETFDVQGDPRNGYVGTRISSTGSITINVGPLGGMTEVELRHTTPTGRIFTVHGTLDFRPFVV